METVYVSAADSGEHDFSGDMTVGATYSVSVAAVQPSGSTNGIEASTAVSSAAVTAAEPTYTWEIPIRITVEAGGSAAPPEETFTVEAYATDTYGAQVTYSVGTIAAGGTGTYTGTLTLTGDSDTYNALSGGFYLGITASGGAGWACDNTEYLALAAFDSGGNMTSLQIYAADDVNRETNLSAAAFTSTYTGYTLTFVTNGGSDIDAVEAAAGTVIDDLTPYATARSGFIFTGWYTDAALTAEAATLILDGDMTLYAGWSASAAPSPSPSPTPT
ncbi:MAG: InlB B-repeat-containing protein, partial [Oscillospiraceae bacterium]|nr:InlB B-repeat-containing protein [Oscillospiraceae bacterium]